MAIKGALCIFWYQRSYLGVDLVLLYLPTDHQAAAEAAKQAPQGRCDYLDIIFPRALTSWLDELVEMWRGAILSQMKTAILVQIDGKYSVEDDLFLIKK